MQKITCEKCEGSGIYYKLDGDADFVPEYCTCIEGILAEVRGVGEVIGITA